MRKSIRNVLILNTAVAAVLFIALLTAMLLGYA